MTVAQRVAAFIQSLRVPEGPLAGELIKLTPEQVQFIEGFLAEGIDVGALSIGRGGGKTTLGAALCLAFLLGVADPQPRRTIELVARVREQARIAYNFCSALITSLPAETRKQIQILQAPRLEIRYQNEDGPHFLRVIASDGKNNLGSSPVFCLGDERGHWAEKGNAVEAAILSGITKRGGKYAMVSTSAPDDNHEFSKWLDGDAEGVYTQEHKAPLGLPLDDPDALLAANPGALSGVGPQLPELQKAARRAIERGGFAEQEFRLYTLNQRIPHDARELILTVEQFKRCEVETLPERSGPLVIGIDLGESQSMSACCFYWYATGRMETHGWFPSIPNLQARGAADRVGLRYIEMEKRGELETLGERVVPVSAWVRAILARVQGCNIVAIVADQFRQSLVQEGLRGANAYHIPLVLRRNGWYHGGEDCNRWRAAILEGEVKTLPSLLLRSAIADAILQRDDGGNVRLSKTKSVSRIDALSASVLAVAHGQRLNALPRQRAPRVAWA